MIKRIKEWFKGQWQMYPLQIVGALLLVPAYLFAVVAQRAGVDTGFFNWDFERFTVMDWAYACLTAVGLLDVWIIYQGRKQNVKTKVITNWVRSLLPKKLDLVVMFGFISLTWALVGPMPCLWYIHGFLNDHFNENR